MSALTPESHLALHPLSVVPDGEEFLVGHGASGSFISIPELGVTVLRALEAVGSIQAVTDQMAAAGVEVDVLDFANTLVECGLVLAVDGVPLHHSLAPTGWSPAWRVERLRPLFSRTAWWLYALLFAGCTALFLRFPQYWPSFEDFFFYPNPALCILVMFVVEWALGGVHELCHWMAARAEGVESRLRVSRRLFFVVFETDLTGLWSVPRARRYSAFMAGMAFDVIVLFAALCGRVLGGVGAIDLPGLERFLGAVVLMMVLGLLWQTFVFFRTDLYAVMVTALGCVNLYRLTYLSVLHRVRRLRPAEQAELDSARPQDLRAVRWFAWLYAAGIGFAIYFFVNFFVPSTVVMAGWIFGSLRLADLTSSGFWEALFIGLVAAVRGLMPLGLYLRERLRQRRVATS